MKKTYILIASIILVIYTISCSKDNTDSNKDKDMVPGAMLSNNYKGTLTVRYTNTHPKWDETAEMNVTIDKELGVISFSNTSLNYSGEEINGAKIIRSGTWKIVPTGRLEQDNDIIYIQVDAGITIENEIFKLYALDNNGNWVLVASENLEGAPNSDLSFKLADAVTQGSVVTAGSSEGSISWTLRLSVSIN